MSKIIITIDRQYGSGGREIGARVAELLGIPKYDEEFVSLAAKDDETLSEEALEKVDERATNSLLYTLVMGGASHPGVGGHHPHSLPLNDRLFAKQSALMRELAEKGSCVMIGRCSDYVLKDEADRLSVFIYADLSDRKTRVAARHDIKESEAIDRISKTDRRRASYYNFYTGGKWGKYENYHAAINSSALGVEGTARLIADMARLKMGE